MSNQPVPQFNRPSNQPDLNPSFQQPTLGAPQQNFYPYQASPQRATYQPQYPITYSPQRQAYAPQLNQSVALQPQLIAPSQVQQVQYAPSQVQQVQYAQQQQVQASIKGESRMEYVPYERSYIDYEEVRTVVQVPHEKFVTDYYAIEYQTEYIPQVFQDVITEYVPVERIQERVEYYPIERQIVHPPQEQFQQQLPVQPVYQQPIQPIYQQPIYPQVPVQTVPTINYPPLQSYPPNLQQTQHYPNPQSRVPPTNLQNTVPNQPQKLDQTRPPQSTLPTTQAPKPPQKSFLDRLFE